MADDNRPLKYARYAVGEIVLVVIGILIALQINNWNEEHKIKKFENEILYLISENLQIDSIAISTELRKAKLANEMTNHLLDLVAQKEYGDTLNPLMGKIVLFERFKSQSSAFEVLKAKGIETIENQELQMALISYYEQFLFNTYQSLNDVENSFKNDWMPVVKEEFSDFIWDEYLVPNDSKEFFENPANVVLFKLYKNNREGTIYQLEQSLEKISEIKLLIAAHRKE